MARKNTLSELVEMVRNEARLSTNSSRGTDHGEFLRGKIRSHYTQLYDSHDWPFRYIHREDAGKDIQAGQRYYDFPVDLDLERAFELWMKWGGEWIRLDYGISTEEYSAFDSDEDERTDPPLKWQIRDDKQFEIWPLPASNIPGGLRFEGVRRKTELVADEDRCDLDGVLVSLFVASELTTGKEAGTKLAVRAGARLNTLKGLEPRPVVRMGMGRDVARATYRIVGGRYVKVN